MNRLRHVTFSIIIAMCYVLAIFVIFIPNHTLADVQPIPLLAGPPEITSTAPTEPIKRTLPYTYRIFAKDTETIEADFAQDDTEQWLQFTDNGSGEATLIGTPDMTVDPRTHTVVVIPKNVSGTLGSPQIVNVDVLSNTTMPKFLSTPITGAVGGITYTYLMTIADYDVNDVLVARMTPHFTTTNWLALTYKHNTDTSMTSTLYATLTGKPTIDHSGNYPVDVTVESRYGGSSSQVFTISVSSPPTITSKPALEAATGRKFIYYITSEDPDGDEITLATEILPSWLTFTPNSSVNGRGKLSGTPTMSGNDAVKITVKDKLLEGEPQEFMINVIDESDPVTHYVVQNCSQRYVIATSRCHETIADAVDGTNTGDSILISSGYYDGFTVDKNIELIQGGWNISFTRQMADTTINGSADSVAKIDDNVVVKLQDLILTGGDASNGGGMYARNAEVTLEDITIQNSIATNGGGIYLDAGELTMEGDNFIQNNTANELGGGILFINSPTADLSSLTISGNESDEGAGIYMDGGAITLSGLTLDSNLAKTHGGGAYLSNLSNGDFSNVTISANGAEEIGSGMYLKNSTATFSNMTIQNNISTTLGGGMYITGGDIAINDCEISGNQASKHGGGLYVGGDAQVQNNTNQIHDNIALINGGGIYLTGTATIVSPNTEVYNNGAGFYGGGMYIGLESASFSNLNLHDNKALQGGGLYASETLEITITGSNIRNNESVQTGGGMFIAGTDSMPTKFILQDTMLIQNRATLSPYQKIEVITITLPTVVGPIITKTIPVTKTYYEKQNAGGIYLEYITASLTSNTFDGNSATMNGGGIYMTGTNIVNINNNSFDNNTSDEDGGAVYAYDHDAESVINIFGDNWHANSNTATRYGGAIAIYSATTTIKNGKIESNICTGKTENYQSTGGSGGGIYLKGWIPITLTNNTIEYNQVITGTGGGVHLEGLPQLDDIERFMTVTVVSNMINHNTLLGPGGGFFMEYGIGEIYSNTFQYNEIKFAERVATIGEITEMIIIDEVDPPRIVLPGVITQVQFDADSGGGFYAQKSYFTFMNNYVDHNIASRRGGGMAVFGGELTMYNNLIYANRIVRTETMTEDLTAYQGSGIYMKGLNAKIIHTTIYSNYNEGIAAEILTDSTAIYISSASSEIEMYNNIIANHDIGVQNEEPLIIKGNNNLWWKNADYDWSSRGFDPEATHYFGDPKFAGGSRLALASDFQIQHDSAAREMGLKSIIEDEKITYDITGKKRVRGYEPDIGAYEHYYEQGVYIYPHVNNPLVTDGSYFTNVVKIINDGELAINGATFVTKIEEGYSPQITFTELESTKGSCSLSAKTCDVGTISPGDRFSVTVVGLVQGVPPENTYELMTNTVSVEFSGFAEGVSDMPQETPLIFQQVIMENPAPGYENHPSAIYTSKKLAQDATYQRTGRIPHSGACRVQMNGYDFPDLTVAARAAGKAVNEIRMSGNCIGPIKFSHPGPPQEPRQVILQGGWNTSLTEHDPDKYESVINAAGLGRPLTLEGEFEPVIQDVTLTGGNAPNGGGVYASKATFSLSGVTIKGNTVSMNGGGIYIDTKAKPNIVDSTIENNHAGLNGAGIYVNKAGGKIATSIIRNNSGAKEGGGVYMSGSSTAIEYTTIEGHTASGYGGGVYLHNSPNTMVGNTIQNNKAKVGGGVFAVGSNAAIISNQFFRNTATKSPKLKIGFKFKFVELVIFFYPSSGGGGAIYGEQSDLIIKQNLIRYNNSGGNGTMQFWESSPIIEGNAIVDNYGNGINTHMQAPVVYFYVILMPVKVPCPCKETIVPLKLPEKPTVIQQNTIARNSGDGVYVKGRSHVKMSNNLIGENGSGLKAQGEVTPHFAILFIPGFFFSIPIPVPFPTFYPPKVEMDTTFWFGGNSASSSGAFVELEEKNNITTGDPRFKADRYHIKRTSAVFQIGKNGTVATDIDNQTIPQGSISDIGSDEYLFRSVHYASPSASDSAGVGDFCTNYEQPCSLKNALYFADDGDIVKLMGGTYTKVYDSPSYESGLKQVAYIESNIELVGGFNPSLTGLSVDNDYDEWEEPDQSDYETIIDAGGTGRGIYIVEGKEVIIRHVTVKNGDATGLGGGDPTPNPSPLNEKGVSGPTPNPSPTRRGESDPNLSPPPSGRGARGEGNVDAGGGIYVFSATVILTDVTIIDSTAEQGGGMFINNYLGNKEQYKKFTGKLDSFRDFIVNNEPGIYNTTIIGGSATEGAGMYITATKKGIIDNIIIKDSTAENYGGGMFLADSTLKFENITIQGNKAITGAGMYIFNDQSELKDVTITSNQAIQNGGGMFIYGGQASILTHTISNNSSDGYGGGAYLHSDMTLLDFSVFQDNKTAEQGGGIYFNNSQSLLKQDTFLGNSATSGGGMYLFTSTISIRDSHISENDVTEHGGGVYLNQSTPKLFYSNTIYANTAELDGGGIYLRASNPKIEKSVIRNNTANNDGGGIALESFSGATLENTQVLNNTADNDGGGMWLRLSDVTIQFGTLDGNIATNGDGGGLWFKLSTSKIEENIITNNEAGQGGGMYLDQSPSTFKENVISSNSAHDAGGGVFISKSDNANFQNNQINENTAELDGGGLYVDASKLIFDGNRINQNNTEGQGGGAYFSQNSTQLTDNHFVENTAQKEGGGFYLNQSPVEIKQCLLKNNSSQTSGGGAYMDNSSTEFLIDMAVIGNVANEHGSGMYVRSSHSLFQHVTISGNSGGDGTGLYVTNLENDYSMVTTTNTIIANQGIGIFLENMNTISMSTTMWHEVDMKRDGLGVYEHVGDKNGDPAFETDGYHLMVDSDAIDQAENIKSIKIDIDGEPRIFFGEADIGADEYVTDCFVKIGDTITRTVQGAMNLANDGDTIKVAGTCTEVTSGASSLGLTQTLYIDKNITIRGGYSQTNWALPPNPRVYTSTLNADKKGRVIYVASGVNATVQDLVLINGNSARSGGGTGGEDAGGAVYVDEGANVTFKRNQITESDGVEYGGGVYLNLSQGTFISNTILSNKATRGGGVFVGEIASTFEQNTIQDNSADNGAGIFFSFSSSSMENNIFSNNKSKSAGGGVFLNFSDVTMSGDIFEENTANNGGAISMEGADAMLSYLTVTTNSGNSTGGGMFVEDSNLILEKSVFNANEGGNGGGVYFLKSTLDVNGNSFYMNKTIGTGSGGGLLVNRCHGDIVNSIISDNEAGGRGSGVYVQGSTINLHHSTLVRNKGTSGDGVYLASYGRTNSQVTMRNSIVVMHTNGIYVDEDNGLDIDFTMWGLPGFQWNNTDTTNENDIIQIGTVTQGSNNFYEWPGFTDMTRGDYHIFNGSSPMDKGVLLTDVTDDIDGDLRPYGNRVDLGADEYVPPIGSTDQNVTIQSVQSGDWNDVETWGPERVPHSDDVVKVNAGDTITVSLKNDIRGLENNGTIINADNQPVDIATTSMLQNNGNIIGQNGDDGGSGDNNGERGGNILLEGNPIINNGTITAGDGGDAGNGDGSPNDDQRAGDGGNVLLDGSYIDNSGHIMAGDGGDLTNADSTDDTGAGGDILIVSSNGTTSHGTMTAGDGGNGADPANTNQDGGDGGDVRIAGNPNADLSGGDITAGDCGIGYPASADNDGNSGDVVIGVRGTADLSTSATDINGGDMSIMADSNGTIDLSDLNAGPPPSINSDGDIILSTGSGGECNLTDNDNIVITAVADVRVACINTNLDAGMSLSDVIQAGNITKTGSAIILEHALVGPGQAEWVPGIPLLLEVTLINNGLYPDSYKIIVNSENNWTISYQHEINVAGLTAVKFTLNIIPPTEPGIQNDNRVTVIATSATNPNIKAVETIDLTRGDFHFVPTIQSIQNGNWHDETSWTPTRLPVQSDKVLINTDHTITVDGCLSSQGISVHGLLNNGTLQGNPLRLTVSLEIINDGQILGMADPTPSPSHTRVGARGGVSCGNEVDIHAGVLYNDGLIRGGYGNDGDPDGSNGGGITIMAGNLTNAGTVIGGDGGNASGDGDGSGGDGGNINVVSDPNPLMNSGEMRGGNGGDSNANATGTQNGGDGGDVNMVSPSQLNGNGGIVAAGDAGNGVPASAGNDGDGGDVTISSQNINLSGQDTSVSGDDIDLTGDDDGLIDLRYLDDGAIDGNGDITLSAGDYGQILLNGNDTPVVTADGMAIVASDDVDLDSGISLGDVVTGNPANTTASELLYGVSVLGPSEAQGQGGIPLSIPLSVLNMGALDDIYTLVQSNELDWGMRDLPAESAVISRKTSDVILTLLPPSTLTTSVVNRVTITATSKSDLTVIGKLEIMLKVGPFGFEPTIWTIQDGTWTDRNTWNLDRIPKKEDHVLVSHVVMVPAPVAMTQLLNKGRLETHPDRFMLVKVSESSYNEGQIVGSTGKRGYGKKSARKGNFLKLKFGILFNSGEIHGGDGGDGDQKPADGASVTIESADVINSGEIHGGDGGHVLSAGYAACPNGGNVNIIGVSELASTGNSNSIVNTGIISGGNGGLCDPMSADKQEGGNGGDVNLTAGMINIIDGTLQSGTASLGVASGQDGTDGRVCLTGDSVLIDQQASVIGGDDACLGANVLHDETITSLGKYDVQAMVSTPITVTVVNMGSQADSYTVAISDTLHWTFDMTEQTVNINPYSAKDIIFNIIPPAGVLSGTIDTLNATANHSLGASNLALTDFIVIVGDYRCEPTVLSFRDGLWYRPSTWHDNAMPDENDVVYVAEGHTVTMTQYARVKALCNYGTLVSSPHEYLRIDADNFIYNYGRIIGESGDVGNVDEYRGHSSSIELRGNPISNGSIFNSGLIRGGHGNNDYIDPTEVIVGVKGGDVAIFGEQVTNVGIIEGGMGGSALSSQGDTTAGDGGQVAIISNGLLRNEGMIISGQGGQTLNGKTANDGNLLIIGREVINLNGGQQKSGYESNSLSYWQAKPEDSALQTNTLNQNGQVIIGGNAIYLDGESTWMFGRNITMQSSTNGIVDLSDLSSYSITSTQNIFFGLGQHGQLIFRGDKNQVVQAGLMATVAISDSADIKLDNGITLETVMGQNHQVIPYQTRPQIDIAVPNVVSWEWSEYLDLHISIINGSPMTDTIQVKMENAQIEFTAVVAERLVEGLSHDSLTVRLKQTDNHWDGLSMGGTNLITFTVRSSNDSNIEVARSTLVYITPYMDRDITSAYLPIILKK